MAIQSVGSINEIVGGGSSKGSSRAATPFSDFLDSATKNLEEVNSLNQEAEAMSVDFALGKIDNVEEVMVVQEKASIALQYTVQLRNKLLDAYNEIMRIQV